MDIYSGATEFPLYSVYTIIHVYEIFIDNSNPYRNLPQVVSNIFYGSLDLSGQFSGIRNQAIS